MIDTGITAELLAGASRFRGKRVDLSHQWFDPVIVAGPWLAAVGALVGTVVVLRQRFRRRRRQR